MKKFFYRFSIIIVLFCILLFGSYLAIRNNLWTEVPNARIFDNGGESLESKVYVSKEGDFLMVMRTPDTSGAGYTFVFPKIGKMGIGGTYWEFLGYAYTRDDYRSHLALSGNAKFGGRVKIENEQIDLIFDPNRTITICFKECEIR